MDRSETSTIRWGDTELSYRVRRSARRRKTVAVTVDPAGDVLLVAPRDFAMPDLDTLVRRKAPWIVQRIRNAGTAEPAPPPREFVSGESVFYLGRHYRLKVEPGHASVAKLRGGWLHVGSPLGPGQSEAVRAAVITWLRCRAVERLPERLASWHARVGVPLPNLVVADQRKRWGSCDRNGTLRVNWRIIQAPVRLVDYVIVHELVHLHHRGHGPDYWRTVGRVMPDYEGRREELRRTGSRFMW